MSNLTLQQRKSAIFDLAGQAEQTQMSVIKNLTFHTPWAARVFGLTLAVSERGIFSMKDFQGALIKHIEIYEQANGCIDGEDAYYSAWVAALSDLLQEKTLISTDALAAGEEKVREALVKLQHEHDHDHAKPHHQEPKPAPIFVEASK